MRIGSRLGALIGIIALLADPVAAQRWSPDPWLADLAQMKGAFETRYANRDWVEARGLTLDAMFDRAAGQVRAAGSDADARAVFDRLAQRFADGHVEIEWPKPREPAIDGTAARPSPCDAMDFDARQSSPRIAPQLAGYAALPGTDALFPAGLVTVAGKPVGVLRISVFQPQGSPDLCRGALAALHIPADKPCDDACQDAVLRWAYDRMTATLTDRIEQIRRAGATTLIVDVSNNGGGSEWVEAVARMVAPVPLTAERLGFVRGPQWEKEWATLAGKLRAALPEASPNDVDALKGWIEQAEQARTIAATPCKPGAACIGRMGFSTGLVGSAPAGHFDGRGWGSLVFSSAQYHYRDSVWRGPLVVLVDDETWSAAEEFAAELQDNHAAIILGQRTGGAGCGHTDGSEPLTLAHSGAKVSLPDCVRFRLDGSNEVRGVIPDMLVGIRASDRPRLEAQLLQPALAEAVIRAEALRR